MSKRIIPQNDTPKQLDLFSFTDNEFPFPEVATPDDMPRNTHVRRARAGNEWVYSVVDLIAWANKTDFSQAAAYWRGLKRDTLKRGVELVSKSHESKMMSTNGRMYKTDCANRELLLRLIQEIPAARTDIIKDWLARVGSERLEEIENPEKILPAAERRYINAQMARGLTESEAIKALKDRRDGRETFKGLTDLIRQIVTDTPNYGQLINSEYMAIFDRTAKQLEAILDSKSIRDDLPQLQYQYIRTAEQGIKEILKQRGRMSNAEIAKAIYQHAKPLGVLLQELCEMLHIDLVTGKPLLSRGR